MCGKNNEAKLALLKCVHHSTKMGTSLETEWAILSKHEWFDEKTNHDFTYTGHTKYPLPLVNHGTLSEWRCFSFYPMFSCTLWIHTTVFCLEMDIKIHMYIMLFVVPEVKLIFTVNPVTGQWAHRSFRWMFFVLNLKRNWEKQDHVVFISNKKTQRYHVNKIFIKKNIKQYLLHPTLLIVTMIRCFFFPKFFQHRIMGRVSLDVWRYHSFSAGRILSQCYVISWGKKRIGMKYGTVIYIVVMYAKTKLKNETLICSYHWR